MNFSRFDVFVIDKLVGVIVVVVGSGVGAIYNVITGVILAVPMFSVTCVVATGLPLLVLCCCACRGVCH